MLENINSHKDVHKLGYDQLELLCKELRKYIIDVTRKNGGHLASSLGATELAVALVRVFDPLNDRIVWDVGHQSYAYKILTGRRQEFATLRQFNGMGGFNDPEESPADAFRVGHSSTSISAALGILAAKEQQGKNDRVVAVIGDGALTGGMSFEALNHAGHLQKNLLVILNDNEMSISPNVGALQDYLTGLMVSRPYNDLRRQVWDMSSKLPNELRKKFIWGARKLEGSLKNIVMPRIIFEDLGFKYTGPIDGHDLTRLVRVLNRIKRNMDGPVLLHVVTQKGRGYQQAENDATKYHGVAPYIEETDAERNRPKLPAWSKVFGNKLNSLAQSNPNIVGITAAMCDGTGLKEFSLNYPKRFYDVGIAEQHALTFAAGMAITGLKPFVALYSTFMQRAYDQLIHDIALQKLPVVVCLDRAGLVGEDGPTHHGTFDLSYLNPIPDLVVIAPSTAEDLERMLEFAANYTAGPIVIRYPRGRARTCTYGPQPIQLGKFRQITAGQKVVFVGIGAGTQLAEETAQLFIKNHGLTPGLVDARFLKPLDSEMLDKLATDYDLIVTFEENAIKAGFGTAVRDYLWQSSTPVLSIGLADEFVTHGTTEQLKQITGFNPNSAYQKVKQFLNL